MRPVDLTHPCGLRSVHKCCCKACVAELLQQEAPRCPMCHCSMDAIVLNFDDFPAPGRLTDSSSGSDNASAALGRSSCETSSPEPHSSYM